MSAAELDALAERCEAAPWPDRELDAAIADSLRWWPIGYDRIDTHGRDRRWCDDRRVHDRSLPQRVDCPQWTASLDAAMTLVPEGWFTRLAAEDRYSHSWRWDLRGGYGIEAGSRASTPALALTAACLRACAYTAAGASNAA